MSLRRARALLLLGAAAAAACLVLLVPTALAAEPKAERWRDHTLNQAGPSCIAGFQRVVADNYQRGDPCVSSVQQAFAAVNKEACPSNMTFVQECMGKTSTSADALTALVSRCPLLNVERREGPGEPTSDTSAFSCFGTFEDPEAFRAYANGTTGAPKGSYAAKSGAGVGASAGALGATTMAAMAAGVVAVLLMV